MQLQSAAPAHSHELMSYSSLHFQAFLQWLDLLFLQLLKLQWSLTIEIFSHLAPVIQGVESTIHWKYLYPLDISIGFGTYPGDCDLPTGYGLHSLTFEKLLPEVQIYESHMFSCILETFLVRKYFTYCST